MRSYIIDEIRAYVTIRDLAVAEAEKEPSMLNLERACIANEFVEKYLQPARHPYEAQHLEEPEAAREREHCQDVRIRLSLLRAHLEALAQEAEAAAAAAQATSPDHAHAA